MENTRYKEIEKMRAERDNYIKKVQNLDDDIKYKLLDMRIEDTKEVLGFIHKYSNKISKPKLDTLITHCCNKLNGNIDDVTVDLDGNRWLGE